MTLEKTGTSDYLTCRIQRGLSGVNRILTLRAPVRTSGSRSTGYFEEDISGKTDIISYVLKMREKIAATAAMAQCVQGRQKAWYDRCARTRCSTCLAGTRRASWI